MSYCKTPTGTKLSKFKLGKAKYEDFPAGAIFLGFKESAVSGSEGVSLIRQLVYVSHDLADIKEWGQSYPATCLWSTKENWDTNWAQVLRTIPRYKNFNFLVDAKELVIGSYGLTKDYDVVVRAKQGWLYWENDEFKFSTEAPNVQVLTYNVSREDNHTRRLKSTSWWVTIYHGQYTLVKGFDCEGVPFEGVNGKALNNSRFSMYDSTVLRIPAYNNKHNSVYDRLSQVYPFTNYDMGTEHVVGKLNFSHKGGCTWVDFTMTEHDVYGVMTSFSFPIIFSMFDSSMVAYCSYLQCLLCLKDNHGNEELHYDPVLQRWSSVNVDPTDDHFININGEMVSCLRVLLRRNENGEDYYTVLPEEENYFTASYGDNVDFFDGEKFVRCVWNCAHLSWIRWEDCQKGYCLAHGVEYDSWANGGYIYDFDTHPCEVCGEDVFDFEGREMPIKHFVDGRLEIEAMLCPRCTRKFRLGKTVTCNGKSYSSEKYIRADNAIYPKDEVVIDEDGYIQLINVYYDWNPETKEWELDNSYSIDVQDGVKNVHMRFCTRVHPYGYKPTPIFHTKGEDCTNKFLGVELELMHGGESNQNARCICAGNECVYTKHDGSLDDGLEVVTHPCTLAYHTEDFGWGKLLDKAKELGYDTPSGSGIHVHVSRAFWKARRKSSRIAYVVTFCDTHREALRIYANRDTFEFNRWATAYMSETRTVRSVERKFSQFGCHAVERVASELYRAYQRATCHYYGVNLSNDDTVEFRFFHSSTDPTRVISILQFVDCITDMSMTVTQDTMINFERIKAYATQKGYSELLNDANFVDALEYDESHPIVLEPNDNVASESHPIVLNFEE